jgi:hypothetical protein
MSDDVLVLLNGKYVKPEEIDPAKHKFIGYFRPPRNPLQTNGAAYLICACGEMLKFRHEAREHFESGCFDTQQYVDLP